MVELAASRGCTADINPVQEPGFLDCRSLTDPEHHVWGALWRDPAAITEADKEALEAYAEKAE